MGLLRRGQGKTYTGRSRWTIRLAGRGNQTSFAGGREDVIYVGDGDGVMYTDLRFRAYSLTDGREVASVRTGTTVRCMAAFPDGDLLAATDHRLHRLDPTSLAEHQRWERGVPDFGSSIALTGDICAIANWRGPWVALVNLADGKVRRRRWVGLPRLVGTPASPLLIASKDGEVSSIDLVRGERTSVLSVTGARDAVVNAGLLWLIEGRPEYGVADDGESQTVLAYDLDLGAEVHRVRMASSANRLSVDGDFLWVFGRDSIVEVCLGEPVRVVRRWPVPPDHQWSAVDPVRRLGFSTTTAFSSPTTLTCHVLEPD